MEKKISSKALKKKTKEQNKFALIKQSSELS